MTLVPLEQSKHAPPAEVIDLRSVAEIVTETIDECEHLLAEADRSAASVRSQAAGDAARTRGEAAAQATRQIERSVEMAEKMTEDAACRAAAIVEAAEARRAEVEWRISTIRCATRAAAGFIESTVGDTNRWAMRRREQSETEAVELLEASWRAATALQRELLEESDAEALEILGRADEEAARRRHDAELLYQEAERVRADALRLHEEAERIKEGALRYADEILDAALAAAVDITSVEPRVAPRRRLVRAAAGRLVPVAVLLMLAMGLRTFVAAPYTVAATSMEPSIHDGDRLMVNKLAYRLGDPRRGEVVVFRVDETLVGGLSWGDTLVKRVIGLPGDVVEAGDGHVLVNGERLDQPWAPEPTSAFGPFLVPDDSLFVLGDNRSTSVDSRSFGAVDVDDVVGRADGVIWPLAGLRQL